MTLNSGEYFILGDQRGNAKDSRYFGAVKDKEIKGRVITVLRRSDI
ncbi:MAG: S26 family signal peptidase [Mediterraneibacter sp.]|nr:S26 family signal peptidase [Mediterraneibacter sp.]